MFFFIPQITFVGSILLRLEDKIEKLTCSVCRSNFEGRNCFSTLEINMPTCPRALSLRPDQDRLKMVYIGATKRTSK